MKRIIIFGLSANPPTGLGGHAGIVRWAAKDARLQPWGGAGADEVWVLPVYRHAFAAKRQMASFDHRLAMARLAFESLPDLEGRVRVLETEREVVEAFAVDEPDAVIGTVDVVRWLDARHDGVEWALLLGADTYRDLQEGRWKESETLLGLVSLVAIPRKGVDVDVPSASGAPELEQVSSSAVREDFRRWSHALQPEVRRYIETHGLYGVKPE